MSKVNNSKQSKHILFDIMLLVLSAIGFLLCLLMYFHFLDKLNIKQGWIDYIFMCIAYIFIFIYGVNKQIGLKKKVTNIVSILLMVLFIVFPIFVGYLVFKFNIFPFPQKGSFYIYSAILIIALSISITCFNQCLKFIERRKRSKAEH